MTKEELQARIATLAPGTTANATDLTGTEDHWQVTIVSPAFVGLSMVEQQRLVMGILKNEINSNEVHALSMKTFSPEQFEKFGGK